MEVGSRSSLGTQHMQLDAPTRRVPATVRTKSKGGCCRLLSIGITELHASLQYNRKVMVEMVIIGYFHVHKFVKKDTCVVTWLHLPNVDSNLCLANGLFGFKSCILCLDPVGLSTYTSMQVHYPYEHAACHCSEQVPNACIQYLYWLEAQTPSACVQSYTSKNRHINHRVSPFPLHCIPLKACLEFLGAVGHVPQNVLWDAGFDWPTKLTEPARCRRVSPSQSMVTSTDLAPEAEWDTPATSQKCSVSCWFCSCSWSCFLFLFVFPLFFLVLVHVLVLVFVLVIVRVHVFVHVIVHVLHAIVFVLFMFLLFFVFPLIFFFMLLFWSLFMLLFLFVFPFILFFMLLFWSLLTFLFLFAFPLMFLLFSCCCYCY